MTLTPDAKKSLWKIHWNFWRVKVQFGRNVHSASKLYEECKDFWKWLSDLSMLTTNENYDVRHIDNIDKWLFILSQATEDAELTEDQFTEMKRNFIEAFDAFTEIMSRPTRDPRPE